ncbi:MAG: hypothetical protein PWQ82_539 [Thermosediminibacterales bacterium]|nr:hypothetical protein [Thermosediminibacterales bacterium]MDK2835953.1 hypothetical protein [Thermosediminibacterales bacterium]
MRVIIVTFILFCVFLSLGFYTVSFLDKTSSSMADILNKIEKAVVQENWPDANKSLSVLEKQWRQNQPYWSILINHHEIDNIELSITHIKEYIKSKNTSEARAEIAGMKLFLKHIPENEKLSLENVL